MVATSFLAWYRMCYPCIIKSKRQLRTRRNEQGRNFMQVASFPSANRDELQFPDPDSFDMRRSPNRNIAFGHGIHFCLGAPLGRLEARTALGTMLERWREIQRVRDVSLEA